MAWRLKGDEPVGGLASLPDATRDRNDGDVAVSAAPAVDRHALVLLGLALAAYVAILLYASIRSVVFAPFADPHDWDAVVFATEKTGDWLAYLWAPHANQHIVFARILSALDVEALGRLRISAFLVGTTAALFLSAGGLIWALVRAVPDRTLAAVLSVLAALVLADVAVGEDFSFPVFSVYVFVSAFAALAACALEFSGGPAGPLLFLAAVVCGVLSGFGNAAGLAVWPVLIYGVFRRRDPAWRLAMVIGLAAAYIGLSLHGVGAPSAHLDQMDLTSPAHLTKMFLYFIGYCALPWAGGGGLKPAARLLGLAMAAVGAFAVCRGNQAAGRLGQVERIGRALILFSLATAVLAAFGRVDENSQPDVPTRYFPMASLLQVGLLFAFIAPIAQAWRNHRKAVWGVVSVVLCLALIQQVVGAGRLMRTAQKVRAASVAFDAGVRSPRVVFLVYPDPQKAAAVRAELKRRGLAF